MILVVSQQKFDYTTDLVLDWINRLGGKFLRINGDDLYHFGGLKINLNEKGMEIFLGRNETMIESECFNVGWFRRWSLRSHQEPVFKSKLTSENAYEIVNYFLHDESDLRNILLKSFKVKKWLSDPSSVKVSKLDVLNKAIKVGLLVPETTVCSTKDSLLNFYYKFKGIIVKDLTNPYVLSGADYSKLMSKTHLLDLDQISQLPEMFLPTLFQTYIDKSYEIRSFFLEGEFYSMAIFSQADPKTQIDFRNYNHAKPNRCVPYKLPLEIRMKLLILFEALKLNTGSVDLIKSKNGEYVFLEINPVGQFGMTSYPCNYYLEKRVAEFLIKNDN